MPKKQDYVVALFAGSSPRDMDLVGCSTDKRLINDAARTLLKRPERHSVGRTQAALDAGRRKALRHIVNSTT